MKRLTQINYAAKLSDGGVSYVACDLQKFWYLMHGLSFIYSPNLVSKARADPAHYKAKLRQGKTQTTQVLPSSSTKPSSTRAGPHPCTLPRHLLAAPNSTSGVQPPLFFFSSFFSAFVSEASCKDVTYSSSPLCISLCVFCLWSKGADGKLLKENRYLCSLLQVRKGLRCHLSYFMLQLTGFVQGI